MKQHRLNPEILDQQPPCNPEAERAVLGSILVKPDAADEVAAMIRPGDFYDERHQKIFGHMLAFRNGGGGAIDATLLLDRLRREADLEAAGGTAYLAEIAGAAPQATNATYYAQIVRDQADLRRLIETGIGMVRDGYGGHLSAQELTSRARENLEQVGPGDNADLFEIVSCRELAGGDYAIRFIVQGVVVEGVATMIGGQLKVLKTSLAISLAVSIATGKPFLNTFEVLQPSRVLYFLGEGGLTVAQSCARRVAASFGIELEDIQALGFCSQVPQLAHLGEVDAMVAALTENEATVAFFDPLYLMMTGEQSGNIMAQGPVFRNFNRACEKVGCTPIIVHHLKKNRNAANVYDPPELSELSWSGPAEFAGGWLLVGRTEAYNPDNPGRHSLWLSAGGRAGHSSLHVVTVDEGRHTDPGGRSWTVDVQAPRDARRAAHDRRDAHREEEQREKLERNRKKVIDAMVKYRTGETKTVLRTTAGLHSTQFNAALADLLGTGEAEPCELFKSGKKTPLEGYRLAESEFEL